MSTTTASKMANDTEAQQTSPPSCSSRNIELENVAQIPRVMSSRVERGCFTLPNMPKIFHNKKFCFAIWSLVYIGLCGVVTEFPIEIGEKIIICIFAVPVRLPTASSNADIADKQDLHGFAFSSSYNVYCCSEQFHYRGRSLATYHARLRSWMCFYISGV
ncbi:hypothetical protein P153DRAFT_128593 [Dothidotthia symphoricarpi CBS 119687]|uniref:Uncharacterized protein n=1 Tax=Dothidotthia symphoricarpi CBS 119687 TaxID=1392245 RepID=A0A6A6A2M1_9PLEO|nr:uncharacterized protein P153DRAFT_128593 [Dothidotthia symphoricarpi CBS 119687]KAF2124821.1 hypothetical protein P153DRAFT_128593 [Dothidotthia symphoricarpi CBS 119687]